MATQNPVRALQLGQHVPSFSLPATDGQTYTLDSFRDDTFLVVIFLANHCPYVSSWEDRIVAIAGEFGSRGVGFVGISPADVEKYPQDSMDEMRKRGQERGYPFPYLQDTDQSVARAFGATRTPEVFVFDRERHLVYKGAIDSDWEESSGMENYLRQALDRLITGQSVWVPETPPVGCKIQYTAS